MKSAIIGLVAATAYAQSEIETVSISVNTTAVESIANDYFQFREKYYNHTRTERENLGRALADAYKTTSAKMILNFGKLVPPALDSLAEVIKATDFVDSCD